MRKTNVSAYYVGASGPAMMEVIPALDGVVKGCVHGVYGIEGSQPWGDGGYVFVAVVSFHAFFLFGDSYVAVGFD
ncbi:MAG: hypothetical protein ACLUOI_07120 [Eisenbergiella sp.]